MRNSLPNSIMGVCQGCSTFYNRLRNSTHCTNCFNQQNQDSNNNNDNVTHRRTDQHDRHSLINNLNNAKGIGTPIDGNKPISELNVDELVALITRTIKPVKDDLAAIKNELSVKMKAHDNRLKLLETDSLKKQERIEALESVIIEMQKSINRID